MTELPGGGLAELPPYRGVLVVDTKDFGSNADPDQWQLADTIPELLGRAFDRVGLAEVWRAALFPHNTGDGFGIGFDPRHLPAVVSRFFDELQRVLAEWNAAPRGPARLRMRASLNVGPVREQGGGGSPAVVGSTVVTTHRLLDAAAVREVLVRSDPEQTFLSVALSQRVFDDVLASGLASLPASRVVPRRVRVKEFAGTVYLYVPRLSGELLTHGFGEFEQDLDAARSVQTSPPTVIASDRARVYVAGRDQHITEG
jgi:class 3 adenylate cyclase